MGCRFNQSADFSKADLKSCRFLSSTIDISFIECYTSGAFKFIGCKNINDALFCNKICFDTLKEVNGIY